MNSRLLLFVILFFQFGPLSAQKAQTNEKSLVFKDNHQTITVSNEENLTSSEVKKRLQTLRSASAIDLVVSSDKKDILTAGADLGKLAIGPKNIRLMPLEKIINFNSKMLEALHSHSRKIEDTLHTDRLGVLIITITTGYNVFVWFHAAGLDQFQKSSMAVYSFLVALNFGLNKDLWSNVTNSIKKNLITVLDSISIVKKNENAKNLVAGFVGTFSLITSLQIGRAAVLSYDHFVTAITSSSFWMNNIEIAGVLSAAHFAWDELSSKVDKSLYPNTNYTLRRLSDFRIVFLTFYASVAMATRPEIYGYSQLSTFLIHGAVGLLAVFNVDKLVRLIENRQSISFINQQIQKIENLLNSKTYKRCEGLFSL